MTWTAQSHSLPDNAAPAAAINDATYKAPAARSGVVNALGQAPSYTKTAWVVQSGKLLKITPSKATSPIFPAENHPLQSGTDYEIVAP